MLLYKIIILLLVSANVISLVIAGQLFHESEERDSQEVKSASRLNLFNPLGQEGISDFSLAILEDKVIGTKTLRDVLKKCLVRRQQLKQSLNAQTNLTPQPNLSHLASTPYAPLEGDAILEMLRPAAANQDDFAISSSFYDPEGRTNPNLIRAIQAMYLYGGLRNGNFFYPLLLFLQELDSKNLLQNQYLLIGMSAKLSQCKQLFTALFDQLC